MKNALSHWNVDIKFQGVSLAAQWFLLVNAVNIFCPFAARVCLSSSIVKFLFIPL